MIWQTRTISTFVAATVPVETEGDVNQLVEQAMNIGVPEEERKTREEKAPPQPANDPKVGSFEAFMSSFGSPGRWAGR